MIKRRDQHLDMRVYAVCQLGLKVSSRLIDSLNAVGFNNRLDPSVGDKIIYSTTIFFLFFSSFQFALSYFFETKPTWMIRNWRVSVELTRPTTSHLAHSNLGLQMSVSSLPALFIPLRTNHH